MVEEKSKLIEQFRGKTLQLTLSDDRVMKGKLECLDGGKNMILGNTYQIRNETETFVGSVMIPGNHIKKVEMSQS